MLRLQALGVRFQFSSMPCRYRRARQASAAAVAAAASGAKDKLQAAVEQLGAMRDQVSTQHTYQQPMLEHTRLRL